MRDSFNLYSDVLFINKRFAKNRFKMPMLLFYVVNSSGRSVLVSMAMSKRSMIHYFS